MCRPPWRAQQVEERVLAKSVIAAHTVNKHIPAERWGFLTCRHLLFPPPHSATQKTSNSPASTLTLEEPPALKELSCPAALQPRAPKLLSCPAQHQDLPNRSSAPAPALHSPCRIGCTAAQHLTLLTAEAHAVLWVINHADELTAKPGLCGGWAAAVTWKPAYMALKHSAFKMFIEF